MLVHQSRSNRFTHDVLVELKGKHKLLEKTGPLRSKESDSMVTRPISLSLGRRERERDLPVDPKGSDKTDVEDGVGTKRFSHGLPTVVEHCSPGNGLEVEHYFQHYQGPVLQIDGCSISRGRTGGSVMAWSSEHGR